MKEEIGIVFDTVRDVASTTDEVVDTLDTVKDICDGACVALGAASVIPGAAAITGPVIGMYNTVRPTLSTVIDVGQVISEFMSTACEVMDALEAALEGEFEEFASEAVALAQKAMKEDD